MYDALGLDSRMPFGKYGPNGKEGHMKLRVIIMNDFQYAKWLFENTQTEFTQEAKDLFEQQEANHA